MAKNTLKQNTPKSDIKTDKFNLPKFKFDIAFFKDRRLHLIIGYTLLLFSFYFLIAFTSYLFTGKADQSVVHSISEIGWKQSGLEIENWLGLLGAWVSNLFIYDWFGIASFLLIPVCFLLGVRIVYQKELIENSGSLFRTLFFSLLWVSVTSGYLVLISHGEHAVGFLCGGIGLETAILLDSLLGWGTLLLMGFVATAYVIYAFNITSLDSLADDNILSKDSDIEESDMDLNSNDLVQANNEEEEEDVEVELSLSTVKETSVKEEEIKVDKEQIESLELETVITEPIIKEEEESSISFEVPIIEKKEPVDVDNLEINIEEKIEEKEVGKIGTDYDPTLDLSHFKYPPVDLLVKYPESTNKVTREELEENKNRIVETLLNYKIGIASIKATIGPTVTLYEIVPESGVRISKIKNLEDDIALSLAALGIRIIAPIPGKGTIGIEVPNTKSDTVSMNEVIATEKFSSSKFLGI